MDLSLLPRLTEIAIENLPMEESGRVLSSPMSTLRKGEIYLVGISPGSKAGHHSPLEEETIRESLERLNKDESHPYVHESWHAHQLAGGDALQLRARWLFEQLNVGMETICASNGVFLRSRRPLNRKSYIAEFNRCWPVHKFILQQVKPKVIVAYGALAWKAFFSKLSPSDKDGEDVCNCTYKPKSHVKRGRFSELDMNVAVFGIPHLSRFTPDACVIKELRFELGLPLA